MKNELNKPQVFCGTCRKEIETEKEYHCKLKVLSEECCIDMRIPHVRKTHWQYLGSINGDYLIPGKNA